MAANSYAATIQFQTANLGGNSFSYAYTLSGFSLQANQALDIQFSPALYGTLSNQVVGSAFTPVLLQPNNPPGAPGDFIALATANNPSLAGPFGVNFIYKGLGTPGSQTYFVEQFDQNGNFVSTLATGSTTPFGTTTVPEPGSFWLGGLALLSMGAFWTIRRRPFARI